ncbi:MAG: phosphate ABC transporter substrate-binding protein PstS [Acidobacteria bacterium]|nr:phosphate ABC transporter substrate-binding protein PstS [Acidobacteriota bacterium]
MTRKQFALSLSLAGAAAAAVYGSVLINGAGATFPYPIYSKWFNEFSKLHPGAQINYQSIGSGGGIRQLSEGTVDFGASDMPLTDELMSKMKVRPLHFPTVLGGVVPTYNVPGIKSDLRFTPEALAGIYSGKITKWNDPVLRNANPGADLGAHQIIVVHRADGSGTTFVWTDYLSKVNPQWKSSVGAATSVRWPVGLGAKGNEGVAGLVKQTAYSIGYVELIYAIQNHLGYGVVQNAAGNFVKANLNSVTEAAAGAARNMPDDFRVSITNAPGKNAYPISTFTWLLVPAKIEDPVKKKSITDFLRWMLESGQKYNAALGYAPLPQQVVAKELRAIALVK